jgi:hypothetical protein
MREIFQSSGAHIYSTAGDVIYAGGGIVALHTKDKGKRLLSLTNGKQIEVDLPGPSTALFDAVTGERLMD